MIPSPATNNSSNQTRSDPASSSSACAACKYQRRRCGRECPLAPYFPAEEQTQFLNAHRLFGVSNIRKALRSLPDRRARDDAMASMLFQSNARASDPVGGCYRIVLDLHRQIHLCSDELSLVLRHLSSFRPPAPAAAAPPAADDQRWQQQQQQECFDYFYYGNGGGSNVEGFGLETEMLGLDQRAAEAAVDDVKPLMADMLVPAAPDDLDGFHCSSNTNELKAEHAAEPNAVEHVQEQDLKEAASLFTLTHCNASSA